jgi:translation initiation factor IF-2
MKKENKKTMPRPPVVVIMGHVDHGKSSLLDYIRKTNVVAGEAGGITQRISAYEVSRGEKKITFLDTPGHEAFTRLRERSGRAADIAILIVAADDGVKPQTLEAIKVIGDNKLPFVVAINKIDKPGADPQKAINQLIEAGVYLEGFGGQVPYAKISAKSGENVPELLELISIVAELNNFTTEPLDPARGVVIESHLDPKRGISATLIVKNGRLTKGEFLVAGEALVGTRILENFLGETIKEAVASSPIVVTGWNVLPEPGTVFEIVKTKKEAEEKTVAQKNSKAKPKTTAREKEVAEEMKFIPVIVKGDFWGSIEALEKEIEKQKSDTATFKVISKSVGDVNENDIKLAGGAEERAIIAGLGVKIPKNMALLAEKENVVVGLFPIIYHLTEWLAKILEERRPRKEVLENRGKAKILKLFSQDKDRQVIGGEVFEGEIATNQVLKIIRRNNPVGEATILKLEKNRTKTSVVESGNQFGMLLESKIEVAPGDVLEAWEKKMV